jgi:hypothetical protein
VKLSGAEWNHLSIGARRAAETFGQHVALAFSQGIYQTLPVAVDSSPIVNAAAIRHGSESAAFIFNIGIGYALIDVFSTLIAQPEFYPDVPLAPDSVRTGPEAPGRFYDYSWLFARDPSLAPGFFTQANTSDQSRFGLGDHLFETAGRFIAYHEQAHFYMGHLSFLGQQNPGFAFHEIPSDTREAAYAETVRALELQADMAAASVLFNVGRNPEDRSAAHFKQIHTTQDWDRALLIAMTVAFMLVALGETHMRIPPELRTHPSAAARTISLFMFYDHFVRAESGSGGLGQQEWVARVLEDIAAAARLTGVLPMTFADFMAASIAEADPTPAYLEKERLFAVLGELRPELEPHLRHALARINISLDDFHPSAEGSRPESRALGIPLNYLLESEKHCALQEKYRRQLFESGSIDFRKQGASGNKA